MVASSLNKTRLAVNRDKPMNSNKPFFFIDKSEDLNLMATTYLTQPSKTYKSVRKAHYINLYKLQ